MAEQTLEQMADTIEALTAKVNAMEKPEKKEDAKTATLKAAMLSAMEHMDEPKKASYRATVMASDDDDMKSAMESIPHKKDANEDEPEKKDAADDPEKEEMKAKISALEAVAKTAHIGTFIASLGNKVTAENGKALTAAMQAYAGDVDDLTAFGKALVAAINTDAPAPQQWQAQQVQNMPKFAFSAKAQTTGRSMEDIINGGGMA